MIDQNGAKHSAPASEISEKVQFRELANICVSGAKHSAPGSEISEKVQFRKLADISVSWYDFQLEIFTNK